MARSFHFLSDVNAYNLKECDYTTLDRSSGQDEAIWDRTLKFSHSGGGRREHA